ncbi:MAG: extracellular solute-binding protein [Oscillospiraceae bacterium]|nr:extracellular solute-binding protein [Oscillospiraceae bacterium]
MLIKNVLVIFSIFLLIGCNNQNHNIVNNELDIMINNVDNINTHLYLYDINYINNQNEILNKFNYNKKASKELWDEFSNTSKINIHEIKNDDIVKTWIYLHDKHLTLIDKYSQILAGIAPDVVYITKWEIEFLAKNKLLYSCSKYSNIINDWIDILYINNEIYGFMEPTHMYSVLWYDKNIINLYGLIDPIELYINNNWNWDTFLTLLLTIQNNNINKNYDPMWGGFWHESAFMAGNGVEFISIDMDGRFIYSTDYKYMNVYNFLNDLTYKYNVLLGLYDGNSLIWDIINETDKVFYFTDKIFNDEIININNFINKNVFMIEGMFFNYLSNQNNEKIYNAGIDISFICAPEGPDVKNSRTGNGWKNVGYQQYCYAITSSCEYPDSAAAYIGWILSDKEDFNRRKNMYIDLLYKGSEKLYTLGIEWGRQGDYINLMWCFNNNLSLFFHNNKKNLHDDIAINEGQTILDIYVNAFIHNAD